MSPSPGLPRIPADFGTATAATLMEVQGISVGNAALAPGSRKDAVGYALQFLRITGVVATRRAGPNRPPPLD
jgi:hypothetical protein